MGEVILMDLQPGVDSLTIVLSKQTHLTYSSAKVVNHAADGYSELQLTFRGPGGSIYQSSVQFDGITDLQASSIALRLATK